MRHTTRENRITRAQLEEYLNTLDVPAEDRKSEGGRIPDAARFGSWLRRNDPVAFEAALSDMHGHRIPCSI